MRSAGLRAPGREELLLHLVDVRLEALDRGHVVVDHAVEDRVQHRAGAVPEVLWDRSPAPRARALSELASPWRTVMM